jgi:hypothetical protein
MADDDLSDATRFDEEPFEDVQSILRELSHLDPDRSTRESLLTEPMPDWAWDRLAQALATEASARAASTHDNVVAFPPAATRSGTAVSPAGAGPRRFRWVGGLVAASAVILAVTIGVQVTGGGSASGNLVAGGAAATFAEKAGPTALAAPQAFDAATAPSAPADSAVAAGAAVEQPAKMVMESNTQYTQAGLTGQVRTLLDRLGVHSASEAALLAPQAVTLPVEDGFTTSWDRIRDCLSWLAKSPTVQAVVIDRGTFDGSEAGIIIAPAAAVDPNVTPPPTATLESSLGTMDVWVVDPTCRKQVDSIMEHLPFVWAP